MLACQTDVRADVTFSSRAPCAARELDSPSEPYNLPFPLQLGRAGGIRIRGATW